MVGWSASAARVGRLGCNEALRHGAPRRDLETLSALLKGRVGAVTYVGRNALQRKSAEEPRLLVRTDGMNVEMCLARVAP